MYYQNLFLINFYQLLLFLPNELGKFDFFDRVTFAYNSKAHGLGIKNYLKALKCQSMEDFKHIEKSVYKCWKTLNHYLFGKGCCKLELDFNNDGIIWFAVRLESFINRHLCGASCIGGSSNVNFQSSDQYIYFKNLPVMN